jgi:hypothetical protein
MSDNSDPIFADRDRVEAVMMDMEDVILLLDIQGDFGAQERALIETGGQGAWLKAYDGARPGIIEFRAGP